MAKPKDENPKGWMFYCGNEHCRRRLVQGICVKCQPKDAERLLRKAADV